jgi:hypothetical protein
MRGVDGAGVLLSANRYPGQFGDTPAQSLLSERVEVASPLFGLGDADFAAVAALKDIPALSTALRDPMACAECPARLTAERLTYLEKHHPQQAAHARTGARLALIVASGVAQSIAKATNVGGDAAHD